MLHLGDVTKIKGNEVPIVDVVTFGAPCQDISIAGLRAGMKHKSLGDDETTRSGLFFDAIRIIKEMRHSDRNTGRSVDIRPRYAVYENVPGAFSSNKGEDFRVVLEEVARIIDEGVSIPRPPKGKWRTTGVIIGDGYSIAWRVFDAQYWGVPQRRRRICLVADFNGYTAPQIVFSEDQYNGSTKRSDREPSVGYIGEESRSEVQSFCESLSRNLESCGEARKGTSEDIERSIGADDSKVFDARGNGDGQTVCTLTGDHQNRVTDYTAVVCVDMGGGKSSCDIHKDRSPTLCTTHYGEPVVAYNGENLTSPYNRQNPLPGDPCHTLCTDNRNYVVCLDRAAYNQGKNAQFDISINEDGISQTIVAKGPGAVCYSINHQGGNVEQIIEEKSGTITASTNSSGNNKLSVAYGWYPQMKAECITFTEDKSTCLVNGTNPGFQNGVCYAVDCRNASIDDEVNGTLQAKESGGTSLNLNNVVITYDSVSYFDTYQNTVGTLMAKMSEGYCGQDAYNDMFIVGKYKQSRVRYIVRRLTPMECERLQGFPDGWTDIGEYTDSKGKKRKSSDAARYKALGNSIALPSWRWILKRISAQYERNATMASLFDGIGGFPLLWEQINGKGSCVWASEIEEFPIAVTKERIG